MDEGWLGMAVILTTIGAMIWIGLHRHIIYPERFGPGRAAPAQRRPLQWRPGRAMPAHRRRSPAPTETKPKPAATISRGISGVAMLENDAEMIALLAIAKLIAAGLVTETGALQTVFAVRAGSSRRYREVHDKLKIAQAELAALEPADSIEPASRQ